MLWTIGDLPGYEVRARDGVAGHVRDVYFDDDCWRARYLVVELGGWFHHRSVLVPPEAVDVRDAHEGVLMVSMTREEIVASPVAGTAMPVSARMARRYRNFVAWPAAWVAAYAMSPGGGVIWPPTLRWPEAMEPAEEVRHLRSAGAIFGHHVLACDRPVGRVHDFALTEDWRIEDLLVETGSWRHHRIVTVAPYWVDRLSWEMSSVFLSISSEALFRLADTRAERHAHAIRLPRPASSS